MDEAQKKAGNIVDKACSDAEQEKKKIMQQAEDAVRDMVVTAAARVAGEKEGTDNDRCPDMMNFFVSSKMCLKKEIRR